MPEPRGHIEIPALSKAFMGLTHQFATGEATGQVGSGKTGVQDSALLDTSFDFFAVTRCAIWNPVAASQNKIMFVVNRELQFGPGAASGATTPGVGGGSVYLSTIGTGRFPQYLRAAKKIPGGSTFTAVVDDRQTVAGAATVRTLHYGWADLRRPFRSRRWYAEAQPYQYVADFTAEGPNGAAIPASGTQSLPIVVDPDWDFEITKVVIVADGEAKLQVKNVSLRTEWFNRAVHIWLLGATTIDADPPAGAWPFLLPISVPEFVDNRGSIFVTVQNLDTVNTNRVQVIFIGRKLMPPGGLRIADMA